MAVLQPVIGGELGEAIALEGARAVLGRHPECDIVLDAAAVSRQHAQILYEADNYFVEDLHSRNGTLVNGNLVEGKHLLQNGDKLGICGLTFTFLRHLPHEEMTTPLRMLGSSTMAEMVDDGVVLGNSTVMSRLDASPRKPGAQLIVNPEVKLRAMIEISQSLGRAVALEDVLPKLLDSMFKIFVQADRGFIILRSGPEGPLVPKAIKHRRPDMEDRVRISRTIINQVIQSKEAILSADAANDMRFDSSQSIADLRIRSVMCVPLINSEGEALGAIQVDTGDQRHRFSKDDLDVLVSIASQAAVAIDNAQMHEAALRRNALDRDLELAHKVQRGLLPEAPPRAPGYDFFDYYESAYQVGGDYYDYIEMSDDRLAIVLGDVSGHGVPAALLMAKLSGEVRYCVASERTPAAAVDRINAMFCRSGWDDKFVTFILVVLDQKRNELTVVNAGHMAPMVRTADGRVETMSDEDAGLPLGINVDESYKQITRTLALGEVVVLYTDGISEAMNSDGELYSINRLREQVGVEASSIAKMGRHILDDVRKFCAGHPHNDDMCLACFGRAS